MECQCATVTSLRAAPWNFQKTHREKRWGRILPLLRSLLADNMVNKHVPRLGSGDRVNFAQHQRGRPDPIMHLVFQRVRMHGSGWCGFGLHSDLTALCQQMWLAALTAVHLESQGPAAAVLTHPHTHSHTQLLISAGL